ncbi:uncharacterized protein LOC120809964 [Gasterosteus aculeatus]
MYASMRGVCRRDLGATPPPNPPLHVEHVPVSYKLCTSRTCCTFHTKKVLATPPPPPPPYGSVPSPGGAAGLESSSLRLAPASHQPTMIIRLGRLTPGYFRLLQRQVAGEVQTQPRDRAVNQLAMMLAIMGLSLSYYSAKQMTEDVRAQPAP